MQSAPDTTCLPVMLRLDGRRCLVVGGGETAARRAAALLACGSDLVVVAPVIHASIDRTSACCEERPYRSADVTGAFLVVVATNDQRVNQQVAEDAARSGAIVNRADLPEAGDLTVMAHTRRGGITVAVDTGGASASAARALRDAAALAIDDHWVTLLDAARGFRSRVQAQVHNAEARRVLLRRLTDRDAARILTDRGPDGLLAYYEQLLEEADTN